MDYAQNIKQFCMFKPLIHDVMQLENRRLFCYFLVLKHLSKYLLIEHLILWVSKQYIISKFKVTLINTNTCCSLNKGNTQQPTRSTTQSCRPSSIISTEAIEK
jgi:hypothetical protein